MIGRRLILSDSTTIENGEAGFADETVVCFVPLGIMEAFAIFGDSNKTSAITFQYGDMEDHYEGYTQIVYVTTGDRTAVGLRRPNA